MLEKTCSKCKKIKSLEQFNKNKWKGDGLQSDCKDCSKSISRAYYAINAEKQCKQIHAARKIRRKIHQKFILDYLKSHPCFHCGESDPIVLEFDHLRNKRKNLSHMIGGSDSIDSIKKEIEKCQVLCANCHRRKTAKDYKWYKYSG